MIKQLFSLFAIATLTSFAYANEEVTNAPVILEEVEVVKGDLLAAEDVLLEEEAIVDEQKTELADCGCGCGCDPKKKGKNDNEELLAGCKSCKKKKKQESEPAPVEAPKEVLADNTAEATDEILPLEEAAQKFATCCPVDATEAAEEILPVDEAVEKFAACPSCPSTTEAAEEILPVDEAVEKFAACPSCPSTTEAQDAVPAEEIIEETKLA